MATRTARSVARSSALSRRPSPSAPRSRPLPTAPLTATRLRLALARTGDHPSIHDFLLSVFHGPTAAEFQAQLDEPGYEPIDRLLVKHGDEIVAHLRLARQTIQLGAATLPVARCMDLATAPELRSRGLATALLAAGERAAAERGLLLGLTRTRAPALFARHGWSICGRHVFSTASPRAVLAELATVAAASAASRTPATFLHTPPVPIIVRPLRRIELTAVVRLYEQRSRAQAGWPTRSEAYWEWLLTRGACDRIYVASTAAETPNFAALLDSIIGYACVRQSRIVEIVTATGRDDVPQQLAERVCADAREQDGWTIRYDAPPSDALHDLFRRAGGQLTNCQELSGELFMAKLLDPLAVLRRLLPIFSARADAADLSRPCELGIELRAGAGRQASGSVGIASGSAGVVERFRLCLTKREAHLETGGPSRHSIALAASDLAPLVLGDCGAAAMAATGRLQPTTAKAASLAAPLFPGDQWWRPALDDLLA
jgi:predicted N-acetyltransferase YhbS